MEEIPNNQRGEESSMFDLESLNTQALTHLYRDVVGANAVYHGLTSEEMINGIQNPEDEKARIRMIKAKENEEDRNANHR